MPLFTSLHSLSSLRLKQRIVFVYDYVLKTFPENPDELCLILTGVLGNPPPKPVVVGLSPSQAATPAQALEIHIFWPPSAATPSQACRRRPTSHPVWEGIYPLPKDTMLCLQVDKLCQPDGCDQNEMSKNLIL